MKKTFPEWMKAVDAELVKLCGMSSADLEDICYRDLYDAKATPKSAAKKAYKNSNDY